MLNSRQNHQAKESTPIVVIAEESGDEEETRKALRLSSRITQRETRPV